MTAPAMLVLILGSVPLVSTESHSLSLLATLISGESPFPEFSMVLKVNDIPVEYGDSIIKKAVSRRHWSTHDTVEEQHHSAGDVFYTHMKMNLHRLMKHFNHTRGIHVYQALTACDETKFVILDAYNGEEVRSYDIHRHTFQARVPEILWTKVQMEATKVASTNVFRPLCVRTLKRYLHMDKNVLLRKERPRVRVIQKKHPDSGRTQVSCVATGFYPRRVNMTLLRDNQPVPDQELTGGQVLPNRDGTYQLRRSLSVSEEELRERHRYTCTVSHLSVDNKLDVTWEAEAPPDTVFICVVLITVLALTALITATVLWRRRRTGAQNSSETSAGMKYTAAHRSDQSDASSTSSCS